MNLHEMVISHGFILLQLDSIVASNGNHLLKRSRQLVRWGCLDQSGGMGKYKICDSRMPN